MRHVFMNMKTRAHLHTYASGVCLESGHVDSDCCAMPGSGSCSEGYTFSQGDKCHDVGAYTTCCVRPGYELEEGAETENAITDSSSGVVVAVSIFSAFNTLLLVLYLLIGGCAKKVDDNVESHGLLLANQNRSLRGAARGGEAAPMALPLARVVQPPS